MRLVESLSRRPGVGRLLLLSRDVLALPRRDEGRESFDLDGLDEASARQLWLHLEELYGPTRALACDQALARTRGMPLAMRREYARCRYGEGAWELGELPEAVRHALEAVSVARLPVAPAAVAAILKAADVEASLIELVSRQLIDPLLSGRFSVHDVVRDQVVEAIPAQRRKALELRAAELIRGGGRGISARRMAWLAGDDGAVALLDDLDRTREVIEHLVAAGEIDQAVLRLEEVLGGALARGGGGELLALIARLRQAGGDAARLDALQASVALRHGRIAEAVEFGRAMDAVMRWHLRYRMGDVTTAQAALRSLMGSSDPNEAALAASYVALVELELGRRDSAMAALEDAFAGSRQEWSATTRARVHLAFVAVYRAGGDFSSARASLARASSSAADLEVAAEVEALRVRCLLDEGRTADARSALDGARRAALEVDCVSLRDELEACEAALEHLGGRSERASERLRDLVDVARERGDEVSALRYELQLAETLFDRDMLGKAAELVVALDRSAQTCGLDALLGGARALSAAIALRELRFDLAAEELEKLKGWVPYAQQQRAETSRALLSAWNQQEYAIEVEPIRLANVLLARGESAEALSRARAAAIHGERTGLLSDVARSLAIVARLELARGDRAAALAAASRAARDARECGVYAPRIESLLVLASIARDEGEQKTAATYARDALELATEVGLPFERLVAARALSVICSGNGPSDGLESASAATVSRRARGYAEQALTDLGFTEVRPFRCVAHDGATSYVTAATPELLGVSERDLLVDAVSQCIFRKGEKVADLRRRSLLKKLLFLFAAKPGHVFSKEEIVEQVWEVSYHPLRHDAALFTNIMRIRRLLGEDGGELIAVSEDGYRLAAPKDFLYVENSGQ
jgi:hypothetical protein